MSSSPSRNRSVYFVGAGLSCAVGLPNTAQLIDGVLRLAADKPAWGVSHELPKRLAEAFEFFYPDGRLPDFRPDVGDFFAALATYVDVGAGLPGARLRGKEATELYDDLRFAICHLLIEQIRAVDEELARGHSYLSELLQPGNVLITSNWDILLERYAHLHGVPCGTLESPPTSA